ncbi:MAG: DeoR/GlpR family DNA-binding transcription regulator [Cellulomonas sp.]
MAARRTKEQRHQGVLAILKETGAASVAELGARLGVAEMTIRRDLETLEGDGALKRFHGGAKLTFGSGYEPPLAVRERTNSAQKRAIAEQVDHLIDDGDTLILDGGSTAIAVAQALTARHITICPLSLRVAWAFERSTTVNLILPPGAVRHGELSISGADTADFLRRHHFDHYVMTSSGVSLDQGFTEWNAEDAAMKRTALDISDSTIVAVDSSKFGSVRFVQICEIERAQIIVTDSGLGERETAELERAAQHVVIAPMVPIL